MSDNSVEPFIGPADLALFSIADTRERADQLKKKLVPKLKSLVDDARYLVAEIYGPEILKSQRIGTRPAHRKAAKRTDAFSDAHAGFHPRDGTGYFSLQIQFLSGSDPLLDTVIHAYRPREAEALFSVFHDHRALATRLCEEFNYSLWCPKAGKEWDSIESALDAITVRHEEQWFVTQLVGEMLDFPILDEDAAWNVVFDFVAMFPIFQAASDRLLERPDRFEELIAKFWEWHRRDGEAESGRDLEDDTSERDAYQISADVGSVLQ